MNMIQVNCPTCDAGVALSADAEVSEVITCLDCKSKLVLESLNQDKATLGVAPKVEEDWGE